MAIKLGLPTVVLIREPIGAISSLLVADEQLSENIAIESYIDFYKKIKINKSKYVIADFGEVINNPEEVIKRINSKFGMKYYYSEVSDKDKSDIFNNLDKINKSSNQTRNLVATPSSKKESLKKGIKKSLSENHLFMEANCLYNELTKV